MKIFFDTEFTGLHRGTTLISIGLISEDGRMFYAEFTDYDRSQVDQWIQENVIKNLTGPIEGTYIGTNEEIQIELSKWLSQFESVELYSDCCYFDMVLFIGIFGSSFDLPKNVSPTCHDINQDIAKFYQIGERRAFDLTREAFLKTNSPLEGSHNTLIKKHNALYDARVVKEIYKNITK